MQSTAASNEFSADKALIITSRREELTILAEGISRSHEDVHSRRRGFNAALAVMEYQPRLF